MGCTRYFSLCPSVPKHIDGHLVLLLTAFLVCLPHYSKPVNITNDIFCIGLIILLYPYLIVGSFPGHTHVSLNVWLLVALCKHFLSISVHSLALYSWTMLTFSSGKHLKFSDPSIFMLSCYLISGAPLQYSHTVRQSCLPASFALINNLLPLLTPSFPVLCGYSVLKFPFSAELVSSSAEEICDLLSEYSHDSQTLPRTLQCLVLSSCLCVLWTASFLLGDGVKNYCG